MAASPAPESKAMVPDALAIDDVPDKALDELKGISLNELIPTEVLANLFPTKINWISDSFSDLRTIHALSVLLYTRYREGASFDYFVASLICSEEACRITERRPIRQQSDLHPESQQNPSGDGFEAAAWAAFADKLACIFERDPTIHNYCAAIRGCVDAFESASLIGAQDRQAQVLSIVGLVQSVKWERDHILDDLETAARANKKALSIPEHGIWDAYQRRATLSNYAGILEQQYIKTRDVKYLVASIRICRQHYNLATDESSSDRARAANNLGGKLLHASSVDRLTRTRSEKTEYLRQAAELNRISLRLTPPDAPEKLLRLMNTAKILMAKAAMSPGDAATDLAEAVSILRQGFAELPPQSPSRTEVLKELSSALRLQYQAVKSPRERDLSLIEEAVRWSREVMVLQEIVAPASTRVVSSGVSEWNEAVKELARLLWLKHYQTLSESDIREAKALGERLLKLDGTPYGPGTEIFIEDEDVEDKLESTSHEGETLLPQQSPPNPYGLDDVEVRDDIFGENEDEENDLDLTMDGFPFHILDFQEVVNSSAARLNTDNPFQYWLSVAASKPSIISLGDETSDHGQGVSSILRKMDGVLHRVQSAGPHPDELWIRFLAAEAAGLADALMLQVTNDEVESTVIHWTESVIGNLGADLLLFAIAPKAKMQGRFDLEERVLRRALAITPGNPQMQAEAFSCLAKAYHTRFMSEPKASYLETAIGYAKRALGFALFGDSMHRNPKHTIPLVYLLREKYKQRGAFEDLQASIKLAAETLMQLKLGQVCPEHTDMLHHLAMSLIDRYHFTESTIDLEVALVFERAALCRTSLTRRDIQQSLSTITAILGTKHNKTEDGRDLDRQIKAAKMSVHLLMEEDINGALPLHSLSVSLRQRFSLAPDKDAESAITDINMACRVGARASRAAILYKTMAGRETAILVSTGRTYLVRFETMGDEGDREIAEGAFVAATDPGLLGSPNIRLEALIELVKLRVQNERPEEALASIREATEVFSHVSSFGTSLRDKKKLLTAMSGVPSDAAALAIIANDDTERGPLEAMHLLERWRGVFLSTMIEERSEADLLRTKAPELYRRFQSLREEISRSTHTAPTLLSYHPNPALTDNLPQRQQEMMEALLRDIRGVEGLRHFLLTPSKEELLHLAQKGTIVAVFNSILCNKSFAVIVTENAIQSVELPGLTDKGLRENLTIMAKIRTSRSKNLFAKGQKLVPVLVWLWESVVRPIMDCLGYSKGQGNKGQDGALPRVWWIGVGLLAHLPFHAAGTYDSEQPVGTMDMVASSYTSTIKTLQYAMEKPVPLPGAPGTKVCLVAMEDTPGHQHLPGLEDEVRAIREMLGAEASAVLTQPTAEDVGKQIEQCNIVHLACHGKSDFRNPSRSYLVLARTDGDGRGIVREDRLFVEDIFKRRTRGSGIAFLRACFSADNPDHGLSDEVIHMASAFHLSGFNHVLATMWSTRNTSCGAVSRKFYECLRDDASQEGGQLRVAWAFHRAVDELRRDALGNPLLWASFIHMGV